MEPERLRNVERLYHAALEREQSERAAFLREACGADDDLRRQVEALLAYATKAEQFMESPAMEVAAQAMAHDDVRPQTSADAQDRARPDDGAGLRPGGRTRAGHGHPEEIPSARRDRTRRYGSRVQGAAPAVERREGDQGVARRGA